MRHHPPVMHIATCAPRATAWTWVWAMIAAALAATAFATTACHSAAEQPTPILGQDLAVYADGHWMRDNKGRVVLLRGMNYSGLEFGNFVALASGPRAEDFAQMASWGVSAVRVPISWQYLEPEMNTFDEAYLADNLDLVVQWAADNDILVVPEMHQFYTSPCFGDAAEPRQWSGIGFPTWTCEGIYSNEQHFDAMCDFFEGKAAPDGRPLYDHFIDAWTLVAARYAGDLRIGGFDLFNEPMCIGNLRDFQRDHLNPVLRLVRQAVVDAGAAHTWFYSPVVTRNVGAGIAPEVLGENVAYAPHLYTQTGGLPTNKYTGDITAIQNDYALAQQEALAMQAPLVAAEFGGNTAVEDGFLAATTQFLIDSQRVQDAELVGGLWWAYFPGDNQFSIVDAARVPKGELATAFARPYARRVAGEPLEMSYDAAAATLTLHFDTRLAGLDAAATTEFYAPAAWFEAGIEVAVAQDDAATYELDPDRYLVRVATPARGEVTVTLRKQ